MVVGSKFTIEPRTGTPDRVLVNSNNVRFLETALKASGETFVVKKVNITLTGNIPRSNAQAEVRINGVSLGGQQNFDSARIARFNATPRSSSPKDLSRWRST